jgi:hypothetical protein
MLDGVEKLDSVVFIATTSYPETTRGQGHQPAGLGTFPLKPQTTRATASSQAREVAP